MTADVEEKIRKCGRCLRRKAPTNIYAPLVNIITTEPLQLVSMDYLTLESSKGYENVLVMTDHFTRYACAVPTCNQTAKMTAEAFFNHFVTHYSLPQRIHSDQGTNFQSKLIRELMELVGVSQSRTTPAHAMRNGQVEKFNRTLLNMLGTLELDQKKDWKDHVASLVHAYNATKHASTSFSPYGLMFGREPRLPIDLVLGVEPEGVGQQSHTQYVTSFKRRLEKAHEVANKEAEKSRKRQKSAFDRKLQAGVLEPGDRVLVQILHFEGKHKIADNWEEAVYIVTEQPNPDIPVYKVRPEKGGQTREIHRNHLLPVGPTDKGKQVNTADETASVSEASDMSDYEDDMDVIVLQPRRAPENQGQVDMPKSTDDGVASGDKDESTTQQGPSEDMDLTNDDDAATETSHTSDVVELVSADGDHSNDEASIDD